jgi:rhamnogalacturonan endolyase
MTFSPVADTYTQSGVNAGSAQVLDALDMGGESPGDHIVYIRFDLSGVDLSNIQTATLNLHKVAGSRNDTIVADRFDVYGLTDAAGLTPQNWDEATLSEVGLGTEYTNTSGNGLDTSQLFNLNAETGANVSELVGTNPQRITGPALLAFLSQRIDDNGLVTLITEVDANNADDRGWGYGSRENSDPGLRPTLILEDDEPEPDPYPENPIVIPRQMENLNRGIVAVRSTTTQVYVGWRLLGNDPVGVAFNLYRSADGGPAVKLNGAPLTQSTNFVDTTANTGVANDYFVRPIINGMEQDPSESFTLPAFTPVRQYLSIPLQRPADAVITLPAGTVTPPVNQDNQPHQPIQSYSPGDTSVGDLDGDGDYELVVKWDPSYSQDNSREGLTGNVIIDAYDFDGQGNSTLLWRIDLEKNIRAGAHYTQFAVYDLDGDGRAEVATVTAPGTIAGDGQFVLMPGDDPNADYRDGYTGPGDGRWGRVLSGPEYFTVFDGATGVELDTVALEPERLSISSWGDSFGNRSHRFQLAPAYLDGVRPSLILARGYAGPQDGFNARNEVAAYDFRDGELSVRWVFEAATNGANPGYVGQTAHSITVGDVDGDGRDEIITGGAALDDDGTLLYNTGLGHGDALHLSDMDPTNPGLELFMPHESPGSYGGATGAGGEFRDAQTGELLFGVGATNDVGRGVAFDIDPNHLGYEMWAAVSGTRNVYNTDGQAIYGVGNLSMNFGVWWDADPLRELLNGTTISKWRYDLPTRTAQTLLSLSGTASNNGSKSTPSLSADLFGDWREEVIMRATSNTELRIYTTTIVSNTRITTLMHDSQYRSAIAWQNSGYNQPPHPSSFLGAMDADLTFPTISQPSIFVPGELPGDYNDNGVADAADYTVWRDKLGATAILPNDTTRGTVTVEDFGVWTQFFGTAASVPGQAAVGESLAQHTSSAAPAVELQEVVPQVATQVALSVTTSPTDEAVASNSLRSTPSAATFALPIRSQFRSSAFLRTRDLAFSRPNNESILLLQLGRSSELADRAIQTAATSAADDQSQAADTLLHARDSAFDELELGWRSKRI